MPDEPLIQHAISILEGQTDYLLDAEKGAPLGNSIVGSLLAIQLGKPRQYTEAAVCEAVRRLTGHARKPPQSGSITLTRTGQAPLTFTGELLAEADGEHSAGKDNNRWHELAVYQTPGDKYVVRIAYRTRWQGELDHDFAAVCDDAAGVGDELIGYDAREPIQGFPASPAYVDKQKRLVADICRRYNALVSEILAADPAFAERVP